MLEENGLPGAVAGLVSGQRDIGEALAQSQHVDLGASSLHTFTIEFTASSVSFTGSEAAGRQVGKVVQNRFGKLLLELGGNNASIIMPDADLSMAVPSVFFGAVGTAGQRCTSTRRLYLHRSIADKFLGSLQQMYKTVQVGDPLADTTLLGPLHNPTAVQTFKSAVLKHHELGSSILTGGQPLPLAAFEGGNFVQPTIVVPKNPDPSSQDIWKNEVFAPILNVAIFDHLEEAIAWNNAVPQGLSSSLWTRDMRNLGKWIGPEGSDCGIVNVSTGR